MPKPQKPSPRQGAPERSSPAYERARKMLERGDEGEIQRLAESANAPPEALYYIAEHGSAKARKRVAANPRTPRQADAFLASDDSDAVRVELARKIARLVPGLDEAEVGELGEFVLALLERLAEDQLPAVRQIIAEEIKASPKVPKSLILALARDETAEVALPILEYSPLLADDDLGELLAVGIAEGGIAAIARRRNLSDAVAARIVGTLDIPAIHALLMNHSARIREKTMLKIVEAAENAPGLHEAIVDRPNLSLRVMKRVAGFVASALVQRMVSVNGLDRQQAGQILSRARARIEQGEPFEDDGGALADQASNLHKSGAITDRFIVDGIKNRRRRLLLHCFAELADTRPETIDKILRSGNPRAVVALAYRAGLTMRTAILMQSDLALVPAKKRLNAKNGLDYPLRKEEMVVELNFFLD